MKHENLYKSILKGITLGLAAGSLYLLYLPVKEVMKANSEEVKLVKQHIEQSELLTSGTYWDYPMFPAGIYGKHVSKEIEREHLRIEDLECIEYLIEYKRRVMESVSWTGDLGDIQPPDELSLYRTHLIMKGYDIGILEKQALNNEFDHGGLSTYLGYLVDRYCNGE